MRHRSGGGGRAGMKLGGVGIIIAIIIAFVTKDLGKAFQFLQGQQQQVQSAPAGTGEDIDDEQEAFVQAILGSTEDVWTREFRKIGREYEPPELILFRDAIRIPGGVAQASMGPFYLPANKTIYIDLVFFDQLARQFKAPGDFAQAYVIAHEAAHHVQELLGYTKKVHSQRGRVSTEQYNRLSVRLELMADYLAGTWAYHADAALRGGLLESGDMEEALRAATAIGDDAIQRSAGQRVNQETFTHGSSEQRLRWFRAGARGGSIQESIQAFELPYDQL